VGNEVEVVHGLSAGEPVATRHVIALQDGAKLVVAGAADAAPAGKDAK
jgi:hypothetical protein